jgi:hypothetical protein
MSDNAEKAWTFMVWMAGDNNLESSGLEDLAEMKRVGTTDDVNVIAQFDSMSDDHTRRFEITKGGRIERDLVQELGETNTGDPKVAIDFFRWAIERYPAKHLLGVIWNHGSGIDDTDVYKGDRALVRRALSGRHRRAIFSTTVAAAVSSRAIAYDESAKDFLDNLELKRVLTEVKRKTRRTLDVLGFDACLMNMVEVAYQVRGTADVVVGSEEVEPLAGWPYQAVLAALSAEPEMPAKSLGKLIVDLYCKSYKSDDVTQSAFDLSRLKGVAASVDALAKALSKAIRKTDEFAAVTRTLNAVQRFDTADYVDLGHFCRQLSKRSKIAAVKNAAIATIDTLSGKQGMVIAQGYKGTNLKNSSGASIYFPRGPVSGTYAKLDFAKRTAWGTFLSQYHDA